MKRAPNVINFAHIHVTAHRSTLRGLAEQNPRQLGGPTNLVFKSSCYVLLKQEHAHI